jgi:protein-S-isoprenylcysteine O-methyltransferase Ste14
MKTPRVFPLLFMASLMAVQFLLDTLFTTWRLWQSPLTWVGLLPLAAGLFLLLVSAGLFRRRGTTLHPFGEPVVLVQDGLYNYSRNPMYLGMLLILTGVALGLGQPLALAPLPVFVATINRWNIRPEEQALDAQFGDAYRTYCQRVRRWL